jgi:hypothetical protein
MPMADASKLKEICQSVYFPIKGYSISDFLLVNGGLMSILCNATEAELKVCDIDPAEAARSIVILREQYCFIDRANKSFHRAYSYQYRCFVDLSECGFC